MGLRRKFKRNKDKVTNRLFLESLENRTLLNGDGLLDYAMSQQDQNRMTDGMTTIVSEFEKLETYGQLAESLAVVNGSVGSFVSPSNIICDVLQRPVEEYFSLDNTPTVGELVAKLEQVHQQVSSMELYQLLPVVTLVDGTYGQELVFTLDISGSRNAIVDLSFKNIDSDIPLDISDSSVELVAEFDFNLEFGIELSSAVPSADGFYVKNSDITMSASIDAVVNTELSIGMLGAEIRNGNLNMLGEVSVVLENADNDPEGKITGSDMVAYDIAEMVTISADSNVSGSMPVYVAMNGFDIDGDVILGINGGFWGTETLDVGLSGLNADEVEKFLTIDSSVYINILSNLRDWMGLTLENSSLADSLPVADDINFGDILSLPEKIDGLLESYNTSEDLINSQNFASFIIDQMGSEFAQVATSYNQGSNILTYEVSISSQVEDFVVPVGLNFGMGDLVFFEQAGTCEIDARGDLAFSINVRLGQYQAEVTSTRKLPGDGHLSADAEFNIAVNGNEPVRVVVPKITVPSSVNDLVRRVDDALIAAGVEGVKAEIYSSYSDSYLRLVATGNTHVQLTVSADENNTAYTELGLETFNSAKDTNLTHISLSDLTMSVDASVNATDISASAGVGFIGVELTGMGLTGGMGFGLEFVPTLYGRKVVLSDLLSEAGDINAYRMTNDHSEVRIVAPTVSLKSGTDLQFSSSPEIIVDATDLLDNPVVNVDYQNFGELGDLKDLAYSQVISMLKDVSGWLDTLATSDVLDFDLMVTDKSLTDLFSPAKELDNLIASYEADPAYNIQDLETKLKAVFENYTQQTIGDSVLDNSLVGVEFVNNLLTIDLDMSYLLNKGYKLNLDGDLSALGLSDSVSDLAFVQANGDLELALGADIDLTFGIDLSKSSPEVFVSDSSKIDFSVNGQAENIDFDVSLGILNVHVDNGEFHIDDGTSSHKAIAMQLGLPVDNTDHRYSIGQLVSASEFSSLTDSNISAIMPLYFPGVDAGSYLGNIDFEISDVLDPLNNTTLTGPDLSSYIAGIDIMDVFSEGLDHVLRRLNSLFETSVGSYELPIIGVSLKDTTDFLIDFLDNDQYGLTQALAGIGSIAGVQNVLFSSFGPAGFGVLSDLNLDGDINLSDIEIVTVTNGDDIDDVAFNVKLSQQLASLELTPDFDLNIPWLDMNIEDTGSVLFDVGYDLDLSFGVNRSDGFYVETDVVDEFNVHFEASMPDLGAVGNLGFLSVEMGDSMESPSFFNGSLAVDLHDTDGILTISDIFSDMTTADILEITPEAQAEINLELVTGINGNDDFPSLRGGFEFGWEVNSSTGFPGELLNSGFSDIQMNLGDYIGNFVQPIMEVVNDTLEPIRPVVDALTTEIDFGIASYSLIDILNVFGDSDYSDFNSFVSAIASIDNILQQAYSVGSDLWIDFGGGNT